VALVDSRGAADGVIDAWKAEGFSGFATTVAAESRSRPVPPQEATP
jgi:hypothetical protein